MSSETPGQLPTDEEVISALEGTGFLLEHRVARCLRGYGFEGIEINSAYPDPESGKSREIDVRAGLWEEVEHGPLYGLVAVEAVIECKNNLNPFVVIGEQVDQWPYDRTHLSFDPFHLGFHNESDSTFHNPLNLDVLPMTEGEEFIGTQLLRMNRQSGTWRADNSAVYDSILYPLAKATDYIWKSETEHSDPEHEAWEPPSPILHYLFPVIVTAGPVYTVDGSSDPPSVSRVKWARLERDFETKERSSHLTSDLVSFRFLGEYAEQRLVALAKRAAALLTKNSHLYDPEWLFDKYGLPRQAAQWRKWLEYAQERRTEKENRTQTDQ